MKRLDGGLRIETEVRRNIGEPLRTAPVTARKKVNKAGKIVRQVIEYELQARDVLLKTADAKAYEWHGGVGAERSIVAYSAICAHRLTYPTRDISFISYREAKSAGNRFGSVIHCCSEHSQYDPAEGARVVAGPAPQPLAAILLEHEPASDELFAVGTLGGELFNEFFDKYAFRLQLEHGNEARAAVGSACVVQPLENFCRQQVKC